MSSAAVVIGALRVNFGEKKLSRFALQYCQGVLVAQWVKRWQTNSRSGFDSDWRWNSGFDCAQPQNLLNEGIESAGHENNNMLKACFAQSVGSSLICVCTVFSDLYLCQYMYYEFLHQLRVSRIIRVIYTWLHIITFSWSNELVLIAVVRIMKIRQSIIFSNVVT